MTDSGLDYIELLQHEVNKNPDVSLQISLHSAGMIQHYFNRTKASSLRFSCFFILKLFKTSFFSSLQFWCLMENFRFYILQKEQHSFQCNFRHSTFFYQQIKPFCLRGIPSHEVFL
ncbi:hypothetical protein AMECASPLE_030406, partial [Ameca splendens]